jgi:glycolate oxidase
MRLPDLVEAVRDVARKHGLNAISYGHAGDGNLHVNILRGALGEEAWRRGIEPAVRELFERTVAMGGQITGEHGVGYVQKNYLGIAYPPHYIETLRSVKRLFDPLGILNPGKILPEAT